MNEVQGLNMPLACLRIFQKESMSPRYARLWTTIVNTRLAAKPLQKMFYLKRHNGWGNQPRDPPSEPIKTATKNRLFSAEKQASL